MEMRQYRDTGVEVSLLGMGCMRLPKLDPEKPDIDYVKAQEIIDYAYSHGVNYFDTAYAYHGGQSETFIGQALKKYPRESYFLATKMPIWCVKKPEDVERIFNEQLQKCQVEHFDFYLFHAQDAGNFKKCQEFGVYEFLSKMKAEGKIRRLGFSFHDKADVLEGLLEHHPEVEFVQLQINYADWESESVQSRRCYEVARAHGKPVIIMEPVKGGSLAGLPEEVTGPFRRLHPDWSTASWGIRFAASLPGLVTVLSGMSNLDQVRDNLSVMKGFTPLGDEEQQAVAEVRAALDQIPRVPCTECQYCVKGCPQGVDIPGIFKAMNNYLVYQNLTGARGNYSFATREGVRASDCIGCGQCEAACPQHIRIIDELQRSARLFDK